MAEFPYAEDGQWVRVPYDRHQNIACCDCGLVHHFEFRLRRDEGQLFIEWRSTRDEPATAELREQDAEGQRAREACIGHELPAGYIEKMGLTEAAA